MASELSPIAISDDGDLDEVRRLLDRLGLGYENFGAPAGRPAGLRISNTRRALETRAAESDDAFHIVVVDEESSFRRRELRSARFDFVVQQPVHPAALRLLILHALYSGPERRSHDRVAMDAEVILGGALRRCDARLTQLSEEGCGLIVLREIAVGSAVTVVFPAALTEGNTLQLDGRVVASDPAADSTEAGRAVSVAFSPPKASVRKRIRELMTAHGIGSAALHPRRERADRAGKAAATSVQESTDERRRSPRKLYRRPVLASAEGGVHTVIGRDLSTGGMRIAADTRLGIGDEFKLVIYGMARRAPLAIKARVARDDGERGLVLHFQDVRPSAAAWLEETVEALPRCASAADGPSLVVSEIIEDA